jgi:hypothetical protein
MAHAGEQAATHRVGMDVIDHGPQRFDAGDIAVMAAAWRDAARVCLAGP